MKLKNKKTGEIKDILDVIHQAYSERNEKLLMNLEKEWEDYEEPKEYWYIDCDGEVYSSDRLNNFDLDRMANIGNYFETREEAEKAVEKLKAWKRLKDKGFRYKGQYMPKDVNRIEILVSFENVEYVDIMDDLDLLFGGEE